MSLGALYLEPVWVFARDAPKSSDQLRDLAGRRIAIGAEGSGTQPLARMLLDTAGIDAKGATLLPLSAEQASAALAQGTIDAAVLIAGVSAPVIGELVRRPESRSSTWCTRRRSRASTRTCSPLTIPRGLVDIRADLPDHDVGTVAVTANLLVRAELHPALMYLFLDAASEIHGRQTLLADAGRFPNPVAAGIPALRRGRTLLQVRQAVPAALPAVLGARILSTGCWCYLIPLDRGAVPAMRFLPESSPTSRGHESRRCTRSCARSSMRSRRRTTSHACRNTSIALDAIETEVTNAKVPGWYAHDIYALRAAIDLVRERLGRPGAKAIPGFRS